MSICFGDFMGDLLDVMIVDDWHSMFSATT